VACRDRTFIRQIVDRETYIDELKLQCDFAHRAFVVAPITGFVDVKPDFAGVDELALGGMDARDQRAARPGDDRKGAKDDNGAIR
jgi:hypothetical protein